MSRRKSMVNIILAMIVFVASMISAIDEYTPGADKATLFKVFALPCVWALVLIFWILIYFKNPKDSSMFKGKSLGFLVFIIVEGFVLILSVFKNISMKFIFAEGVIYIISGILFYRFYGVKWAPVSCGNSSADSKHCQGKR